MLNVEKHFKYLLYMFYEFVYISSYICILNTSYFMPVYLK